MTKDEACEKISTLLLKVREIKKVKGQADLVKRMENSIRMLTQHRDNKHADLLVAAFETEYQKIYNLFLQTEQDRADKNCPKLAW